MSEAANIFGRFLILWMCWHLRKKTAKPGYVILHTSYEPEIDALNLPDIHIECLPDLEFITR
jgi:hypothetical protein